MTPRLRAGSASFRMALYAPRILNAPTGCSFSSLRCAPSSGTKTSGVRRATPRRPAAASWMSRAVTTLLLGFGLRLGLGLRRRRWRPVLVLFDLLLIFLHHARHVHDQVTGSEVHDLHALGVTARDANPFDRDADHDPLLGDHHQLVVGQHFLQGDDVARLVAALQRDDAATAAMLDPVFVELGALPHALLGHGEEGGLAAHHDHVDDVVFLVQLDSLHAGGRASHVPHVLFMEANAHAVGGSEHDVVLAVRDLYVDQLVPLLDIDRADADGARIAELREHGLLDHAVLGGEEQELIFGELPHRDERCQPLVGLHRDTAQDRLAARRARRLPDLVDFEPVTLALLGEEHDVVMGRRDEEVLDPVVFLLMSGDHALAATPLPAIGRYGQALDVAGVGHGDDHVLFGDQVLDREFALIGDDLGAPLVAEDVGELAQLFLQDLHAPRLGREDFLAFLDELADVPQLLLELRDLERGETRQAHVEDFSGLFF